MERLLKLFLGLIFFLLSCMHYVVYTPDPIKDVEHWVKNFEQQHSFSYYYELKNQRTKISAKGDCIIGKGEHISGSWVYVDSLLAFEYIGLGDLEYISKNKEWQELSRGEESDIFAQIKRLLTFDNFRYLGADPEFSYEFWASIPFLAPDRRKEMIGLIKVSKVNYLPSVLWAGLPDSSVYLKIEFYNYNKVKDIKPPIKSGFSYLITPDSIRDTGDLFEVLRKRLDLIDVDYRLKKTDQGIVLTMHKAYDIEAIRAMLAPGVVNVYGRAPDKGQATKIGYLRNDIKSPLFLMTRIFGQDNIKGAQIKFDRASRPYVLVLLKKKFNLPAAVVLEIDSVLVGLADLDISKKMDRINFYIDMNYRDLEVVKACLLAPLPGINLKPLGEEID